MAGIATFVEDTLAIMERTPRRTALCAPVARPGSLWVSVATRRRASVLWATQEHVKLCFTDHSSVTHRSEAFLRLYTPVL